MSNLRCYVTEFAQRCSTALQACEGKARANDCEVTLLLMAASAGIVVPLERLNGASRLDQPINDFVHNPKDAADMQKLLDERFFGSAVWGTDKASWRGGVLTCLMEAKKKGEPKEKWPKPGDWNKELNNPPELDDTVNVRYVVECMRHALAHGNIYTISDHKNNIELLVFATGTGTEHNPFRFVQVSVTDFKQFLLKWLTWLQTLPMGEKFMPEQDEDYILPLAS